jgi:hypothetical protein
VTLSKSVHTGENSQILTVSNKKMNSTNNAKNFLVTNLEKLPTVNIIIMTFRLVALSIPFGYFISSAEFHYHCIDYHISHSGFLINTN